ncbi:unnamed protein product, partial [Iphiclides podalirius]
MRRLLVVLLLHAASGVLYDTFHGRPVAEPKPMRNATVELTDQMRFFFGIRPWCTVDIPECSPTETRRVDGSCNSLRFPSRGAAMTPYQRLLPPAHAVDGGPRTARSGLELPNTRSLRTALVPDGRVHSKRYTQLITYLLLIMTSDVTSLHDTVNYVVFTTTCCAPGGESNPLCMPIPVADDDLYLRLSDVRCLNLTRAITYQRLGCAPNTLPPERINTSPPMLDLSSLYGNDKPSADRFRRGDGGLVRSDVIRGKEWPPNGSPVCLLNQLPRETRCHDAGNPAINSLPGIQLLGLWQLRSHNQIARTLAEMNTCWGDDRLFAVARDINIAYYQNVVYYELMPTVMVGNPRPHPLRLSQQLGSFPGHDVLLRNRVIYEGHGHVDDYDDSLEPRVSIEYVIATRWFHSIQEGRLQMFDNKGRLVNELPMMDYILRSGAFFNNSTIDGFTQGSFRQPCADNDYLVDPEVGERILGPLQRASDVTASDVKKGRDVGLPAYNRYREYCGLPVARSFDDLYSWMPKDQVDVLARTYEDVDDVDLGVAILVERAMPGAIIGPTLACIMIDQLLRWRRADRFWYENSIHPGAFTADQLYEIRKITMARIICDHGDSVDSVQPFAFLLPSLGTKASVGAKVSSGKSSKARCSVAPPPSNTGSTGGGERSSRGHGGGNPVCPRETPKWQKPITNFFITGNCSKDPDGVDKNASHGSDEEDTAESSKPKPKRNVILSDDEVDTEEIPKNKELDESIVLEPLTGENSHKIEEYYHKNNKGKGKGKKSGNKENISENGKSLKRELEDDCGETENANKKIKVT